MPPAFRHGKNSRVCIGPRDLSQYLKMSTISASCDPADVTCYSPNTGGDKQFIPGLTGVTASFAGLFSFSSGVNSTQIDKYLQGALGGSTQLVVTIGPEGDSTGRYAMLMKGDATKLDVAAPVSDAVSIAADILGSDGYDGGVWLMGLVARTSTSSGGAVNFAGSTVGGVTSTGGGVGHFHLIQATTLTAGIQCKVQHSTSGSTWVDLITFALSTDVTFQRSTIAGAIKEKLRGTCNAFTGGAPKTAIFGVAFARRGKIRG